MSTRVTIAKPAGAQVPNTRQRLHAILANVGRQRLSDDDLSFVAQHRSLITREEAFIRRLGSLATTMQFIIRHDMHIAVETRLLRDATKKGMGGEAPPPPRSGSGSAADSPWLQPSNLHRTIAAATILLALLRQPARDPVFTELHQQCVCHGNVHIDLRG